MAGNVVRDQFITVRYASDETNPGSAPDFGLIPGAAELIAQGRMGPMQYMGGKLAINGNDVVELLYQTSPDGVVGNDYSGWIVQDVMGELGVDGKDTAWDYLATAANFKIEKNSVIQDFDPFSTKFYTKFSQFCALISQNTVKHNQ